MGQRSRDKAWELVEHRDFDGILAWARSSRRALRTLNALIFEENDRIRWRALEALGRVAAMKAETDLDGVRDLIRRLLWTMNDESGGTGWHAPEAIGEILANVPALIEEYAPILPSYFHEEPFERGTYWAVARLARIKPEAFRSALDELVRAAADPDPAIRAWAFSALAGLEEQAALDEEVLEALKSDPATLRVYDFETGEVRETTVARIVADGP